MRGFTLAEVLIGLALTGLVVTGLAAAVFALIWLPGRPNDTLTALSDVEQVNYWVSRDANMAETYTPLSSPNYGRFEWNSRTGGAVSQFSITYYYDSGNLMRQEVVGGVEQSTLALARHIAQEGDVSFSWSSATYSLDVAVTSTVEEAGVTPHIESATITAALRPRQEPVVLPPGQTPTPTPPLGVYTYYLASAPVIQRGTFVSGGLAALRDIDGVFHVVNSTTGGGTKWVTWRGDSETMTLPSTISQVEVRFTARSSKAGTAVLFYVIDPATGDFSSTATASFTLTQADVAQTFSFLLLDPTYLAYINQVRVVRIKVEASNTPTFTLSTDQLQFLAS